MGFALALSACGGGGDDDSGASNSQPAPSGIGAAGGTVTGPNGSKVEIPNGALAAVTQIAVDQTSSGAPPLPAGLTPIGQMFAFTPHGTTFAVPVAITMPFDPGAVPAGRTPALFKTNAQNEWQQVAGATFGASAVTGQVTSFSFAQVLILPEQLQGAVGREWTFSEIKSGNMEQFKLDGRVEAGGDMSHTIEFGSADFDQELVLLDGSILQADNSATGVVGSSEDGRFFSVAAEAPIGNANNPDIRIGGVSQLVQVMTFVKEESDATLSFTVPVAFLETHDENSFLGRVCPQFFGPDPDGPCPLIDASLSFDVEAINTDPTPATFFRVAGGMELDGYSESWENHAWTDDVSHVPFWDKGDFQVTIEDLGGLKESFVLMELKEPRTYQVDLSSIAVGDVFHLRVTTTAYAHNAIAGPPSEAPNSAGAYFNTAGRFPVLAFAGLGTVETQDPLPASAGTPAIAIACPSGTPDPDAGVLEFDASAYSRIESSITPIVTINRTGGSKGAVSVSFTTSDGTAVGDADYRPVTATVIFPDGDSSPRRVLVPILQDTLSEGNEAVNLALSQPGGCAALGSPTSATLTIVDDDPLPPQPSGLDPTFSGDGKATLEAFGGDRSGMAVQPDGKVVMVGGTFADFIAARFNADGTLDDDFADSGKFKSHIVGADALGQEEATAVTVQRDGKIVVAGSATVPGGNKQAIALVRLNGDGSTDNSFGTGGFVFGPTLVFGRAFAVAIDSQDRIVVAGDTPKDADPDFGDFIVARFTSNGVLDTTFGQGGFTITDIGNVTNEAHGLKVLAGDKLLVSGFAPIVVSNVNGTTLVSEPLGAVVRYLENGFADPTFGTSGGRVALAGDNVGRGLAVQSDGKIVLAGSIDIGTFPQTTSRFALMRLLANGTIDGSFGTGGRVQTSLTDRGDKALAVALQADGKIVAAGAANTQGNSNFGLARYLSNGDLDASLDQDGKLTIDFFSFTDVAENLAIQSNGKIVLGGLARDDVDGYAVARVLP
ncbi:MAG TPA: Calx-beta domain-containing protein [Steroidobacteraceae bacterium]|nr:Calx-beta domain-containing protein [Steroidobacteraceae bacterium]